MNAECDFSASTREKLPLSSAAQPSGPRFDWLPLINFPQQRTERRPGRLLADAVDGKSGARRISFNNPPGRHTYGHKHTETPPSRKIISHFLCDFIIDSLPFDIVLHNVCVVCKINKFEIAAASGKLLFGRRSIERERVNYRRK
jgi:hypothetical protein